MEVSSFRKLSHIMVNVVPPNGRTMPLAQLLQNLYWLTGLINYLILMMLNEKIGVPDKLA